jgi:5-hydroxyisourate hydrolase-like protein (transthyretin family)
VYSLRVRPGSYLVEFGCPTDPFLPEWWNDSLDPAGADLVTVTAGGTTEHIDATVAEGGAIGGRVTDALTGQPLAGIEVAVYDPSLGEYRYSPVTDSDGRYRATGLQTGSYNVCFYDFAFDLYRDECFDNEPDLPSADSVPVTVGMETSVDASLAVR